MSVNFNSTVIFVKDVERSKDFYLNNLNQEIEFDFGRNVAFKSGLAIWQIDETLEIGKKLGGKSAAASNRFELYFETENLDDSFEKIKSARAELLHEIVEEPWGQRTFRFFDPDEHLIEIGETLAAFVKRFSDQGMSIDEINRRTSVPTDVIVDILRGER